MSFCKILDCLIICVIIKGILVTASSEFEDEDIKRLLVDTIKKCGQQIRPIQGNIDMISLDKYQNNMISDATFDLFEKELALTIKQVYSNLLNRLPNVDAIIPTETEEPTEILYDILILSTTDSSICTLLPQCMDFIYVYSPKNSFVFAIEKWHRLICHTLTNLVKQSCTPNETYFNLYFCNIHVIRTLHEQIKSIDTINTNHPETYDTDFDLLNFVHTVISCIVNIDKTKLIMNSKVPYNEYVFQPVIKYDYDYHDIQIDNAISIYTNTNKTTIEERLNFINNQFNYSTELQICVAPKELLIFQRMENSTNEMVSKILLHSLIGIGNLMRLNLIDFIENAYGKKKIILYYDFNQLMTSTFNKICERIPLIYLYLRENSINDANLLSYYLSFCDDIIDFVISRCPNTYKTISGPTYHTVNCIIETMKDKIMFNFRSTNTLLEDNEPPNAIKCFDIYAQYITEIYDILFNYNTPVHVWPTFVWLSGKYFLTIGYANIAINHLKQSEILVNNVLMTLSETYYLILPLRSNVNTLLIFHNLIFLHLDRLFGIYVCRHAMTIIRYLDEGYYTSKYKLQPLTKSLNWYIKVQKLFYEYLSVPVKRNPPSYIQNLVLKITNIKHNDSRKIEELIPKEMHKEIKNWAYNTLVENRLEGLNDMALINCYDAMDFFLYFTLIVKQSLSLYNPIEIFYTNNNINTNFSIQFNQYRGYCNRDVENMFSRKSKDKKLNIKFVLSCLS